MALQTLGGPLVWPLGYRTVATTPASGGATTLDAAGEYGGIVICAREAMVISHVGMRAHTSTGSPTVDIRIETVDPATGLPTGTLWATDTNIVTTAGDLVTNTWVLKALTASATIAKGEVFCVKVLYQTGTSTATQTLTGLISQSVMPYRVDNTGSPAAAVLSNSLIIALGSSSSTFYYVPGLLPMGTTAVANNTFNNTNSAKRGLKFQVPFKCRAVGARYFMNNASGNFNIILEDTSPAELSSSSTAFDGNNFFAGVTGAADLYFDNAVTLSPATNYRLMVEPSSATNCSITTITLPSADYRTAWPHGTNCMYSTYASSVYDDSATTQLPILDLLIDQLDDGVQTGGGGGQSVYGG
jgi:hypothetical protein